MSANANNPIEDEEALRESSPAEKSPAKVALRARGVDRAEACPEEVIEAAVEGLSGCSQGVLSRAACRGIVDPDDVIAWTERTQKLVRFQYDRAQLRSEVNSIAEGLRELLCQVDLPEGGSPEALTASFVGSLVHIREMIFDDVKAAFEGDPAAKSHEEIAVAYPVIRALSVHRIAHELYRAEVPLIPRIMSEHAHDHTGIDINPGARIGRHFFIDHGSGVVIGETTVIGENVRLYQGVTLGATSLRDSSALRGVKRHPSVEDDVTIYAGATILGGDTVIGAGSVIGGNVWLTESVPPGSRVMVDPPRNVVRRKPGEGEPLPLQLPWDD